MPQRKRSSSLAGKKQSSLLPVVLAISGGVLLLIFAIFLATQSSSLPAAPTLASGGSAGAADAQIERVTLVDAKAAFDAQSALFLDVRDVESFNINHIPGALNIPLADLTQRLGELDKTQWIITY